MKAEVSTSLPSKSSRQKGRQNSSKTCVITHFILNFLNFLLIDILFSSFSNNIMLFRGSDPNLSGNKVVLALYGMGSGAQSREGMPCSFP